MGQGGTRGRHELKKSRGVWAIQKSRLESPKELSDFPDKQACSAEKKKPLEVKMRGDWTSGGETF